MLLRVLHGLRQDLEYIYSYFKHVVNKGKLSIQIFLSDEENLLFVIFLSVFLILVLL